VKYFAQKTLAAILTILLLVSLAACQNPIIPSSPFSPELPVSSSAPSGTPGAPEFSPPGESASGSGITAPDPSDSEPVTEPEPEPVPVRSVTIELNSVELTRGTVLDPKVTIQPADATDKTYELRSGDENVIRLVDGQWTAVGAGTAELIAIADNNVTGAVTVTVTVPAEALSLGDAIIRINRGDSFTLKPVITPADATDKIKIYTSGDESVASVSENGTILGISTGTAIIEGVTGDVRDTCTVTVIVPVTGVSISTDKRAYQVGDQGKFTVRVDPPDAFDKSYSLSISGSAAVLTGDNTFSCDAGGEVTITATTANGIAGKQTFNVIDLLVYANEVLRLTNIERENEGLPALSGTTALTQTAVVRANEIIRSFSHERPDGRSCFTAFDENGVSYRWAGENIAMGQRTPAEVVRAWMDSPDHRENIMYSAFGRLGVGVAIDNNGRLYWSQNFTD